MPADSAPAAATPAEATDATQEAWDETGDSYEFADEYADHADDEYADDEWADDEYADDEYADDEYADDEYADDEYADDAAEQDDWQDTCEDAPAADESAENGGLG